MDKSRYPENWDAISFAIRYDRAQGKCEWCGAPDKMYIQRRRDNPKVWRVFREAEMVREDDEWYPPTKVTLTVHHIGIPKADGIPGDPHDKMDCRPENLAALCNRCHLHADIRLHMKNARLTRIRKRKQAQREAGQLELLL